MKKMMKLIIFIFGINALANLKKTTINIKLYYYMKP